MAVGTASGLVFSRFSLRNLDQLLTSAKALILLTHLRLMDFISEIERAYGKPAQKIFLPMQAGDVYQTNADTTKLETELGYKPSTTLHEGISRFMDWYKSDLNPLK